jgi:hypothetical protein
MMKHSFLAAMLLTGLAGFAGAQNPSGPRPDCPNQGQCDGTRKGPNGTGQCDGTGPHGPGQCDGTGPHGRRSGAPDGTERGQGQPGGGMRNGQGSGRR